VPQQVNDESRLRLELLDRRSGAPISARKNLFGGSLEVSSRKKPLPLPPPPPPPVMAPVAPEPPPPPVAAEPTSVQRDMARFTFLGFLKKDNRKTIFLSNDKEIFLVKKGDKISGKYDVTGLTDESLTISSLQDGGEVVIPLVENKPLQAPRK
jgi:hypothetical protein